MNDCELCKPADVLFETALAYVSPDATPLSKGHVIVVPKRHVESFFDMTAQEQAAVLELLAKTQRSLQALHKPDGYNVGANVGKAAGQSRMHVHVHLIPRYAGDLPDPAGGVRRVLEK
jgi:diadenosine tetraphosphate (Ap4A) HIT family hydrolase